MPTMNTRVPVPEPEWGWIIGVKTVEAERISDHGSLRPMHRIYVNGEAVGFVVGRGEGGSSKRRWWDHHRGDRKPTLTETTRMVYPTDKRQHAIDALITAVKREKGRLP